MDQSKSFPPWIGIACTWIGAALGVFAVTAMSAGLKATLSPEMRTVEIFNGLLGRASVVAFGVAAALMVSGAIIGRRRKRQIADQQLLEASGRGQRLEDIQQKDPAPRKLY
jgi:hypothetical protein